MEENPIAGGRDWRMATYDPSGSGDNTREQGLNPNNVGQLEVKWTFDAVAAGAPVAPIHANLAVVKGKTFVGSYGGTFYAIDKHGELSWSFDTYTPGSFWFQVLLGDKAPIIGGAVIPENEDSVVFGDVDGRVYKLDQETGALIWTFDLDEHDLGGVWGNSLTIVDDTIYVGLSSFEPLAPVLPGYTCCSHRGAMVALDLATGATKWRYEVIDPSSQEAFPQELIDELGGFEVYGPSGGDVWSAPTYDAETDTLYFGTGQLFSRKSDGTSPDTDDAIIALDASTGDEKWVTQFTDYVDVFRFDIPFYDPDTGRHYDKDVADQPKVYRLADGRKVVAAGQKSGDFHVVDALTGAVVSSTPRIDMVTGEGGFQSGGATDGNLVFAHGGRTAADPSVPFDGVVMALKGDGSDVAWEITRPGSPLYGSLAVANGVLYFQSPFDEPVSSADDPQTWALYAVEAGTGQVLNRIPFEGGRTLNGPAVTRGRVYAAFGDAFQFGLATPSSDGGVVCLGLPGDE